MAGLDRRCRWIKDADVPGGKFFVPECWPRVMGGPSAECHCPKPDRQSMAEMIDYLMDRVAKLEAGAKRR